MLETEAEFSIATSLKLAFCLLRLISQAGGSFRLSRSPRAPEQSAASGGAWGGGVSTLLPSAGQGQREGCVLLKMEVKEHSKQENPGVLVQPSRELISEGGAVARNFCVLSGLLYQKKFHTWKKERPSHRADAA